MLHPMSWRECVAAKGQILIMKLIGVHDGYSKKPNLLLNLPAPLALSS